MFSTSTILGLLFLILPIIFKDRPKKTFNRNLPFECGIENVFTRRPPFSLQFFILGLIFIIFDIEILITLFIVFNRLDLNLLNYLIFLIVFIIFLYLTLLLEWKSNKLIWFIWEHLCLLHRRSFIPLNQAKSI